MMEEGAGDYIRTLGNKGAIDVFISIIVCLQYKWYYIT